MTYGLGIKGKDPILGEYLVIASDSKTTIIDKNKSKIGVNNDYHKIDGTKDDKYFYTEAGTINNSYTEHMNQAEKNLFFNTHSTKTLENNLNDFNDAKEKLTNKRNSYIIGTPELKLFHLPHNKRKIKKKDLIATIGSGSPYGEFFLNSRIDSFKEKGFLYMPLQKAIYEAMESQKYAQQNESETVGGSVDLAIKTQNNFSKIYNSIKLDDSYHSMIAEGTSEKIAANHLLKSPQNIIKMMLAAPLETQEKLAEQIAISQNDQYAAAVMHNLDLDKKIQEKMLPAILNGSAVYMELIKNKIHPAFRDQLNEAIEFQKQFE